MAKRTRILIFIIVFLLGFVSFVSGAGEQWASAGEWPEGVIHYDPFTSVNSTTGGHDPRTSFSFSSVAMFNGTALLADPSANGAKGSTYDFYLGRINQNINISFYVNLTAPSQDTLTVGTYDSTCVTDPAGGNIFGIRLYFTGSDLKIRKGGADTSFAPISYFTGGNATKITVEYNNSDFDGATQLMHGNIYINDQLSDTGKNAESRYGSGNCIPDDREEVGRLWFQGEGAVAYYLDDLLVTNKSYNPIEPPPPVSVFSTVNVTDSNPEINYVRGIGNPTINFNISGNYSRQVNVSLFINGTLNQTGNYSAGKFINTSFDITFQGSHYNYYFNVTDGIYNASSSQKTFIVDLTAPTLTTGYINGSVYVQDFIINQFNASDESNLYWFNISIDGTQIYSLKNINSTFYDYNLSYDTSGLSVGNHTLTVMLKDAHTSRTLRNGWKFNNGIFNDYSKYTFPDGHWVRTELQTKSIFDTWTSQRLEDRFTQTLEPNNPSGTVILIEESDLPIQIIEQEGKYNDRWLVIGDTWKDYVIENENPYIQFERINENKVRVIITGIQNTDKIQFKSVGELNIYSEDFLVIKSAGTLTSPAFSTYLSEQTFTFALNKTPTISNTSADFYYNGSLKESTRTSYNGYDIYSSTFVTPATPSGVSSTNISFYWSYHINGTGRNESGTFNDSQIIYTLGLDNCTTFNMVALNINVRDEQTEQVIGNASLDGYFKTWIEQEQNFTSANLTWRNGLPTAPEYQLCIFPNTSIQYTYAQLEYEFSGYDKKLWYFDNTTLDNQTNTLDLYLNNESQQVEFTVTDNNDNPVQDVIIKVQSYNLPTNTYKTTEVLKTDSEGIALGQLVLNTKWYSFILERNREIVLQTTPTKITGTSKKFRLDLLTEYYTQYNIIRGLTNSLTYTNSSKLFSFTWNDPNLEINQACLTLEKRNNQATTVLNSSCTTSTSGTILMVIPEDITTSNTYIATSTALFDDGQLFTLENLEVNFDYTYRSFGLEGLFITLAIVVVGLLIGLWHPAPALLFMGLGLFVSIILDFAFLSWGTITAIIILIGIAMFKMRR